MSDQSKIRRAGFVRGGAFTRCALGRGGVELGDERPSNGGLQAMGSRRESRPAGSPGTAISAFGRRWIEANALVDVRSGAW
jgi:hypothetical protein